MNESDLELQMAIAVTEASTLTAALRYIREGRIAWALELLEVQLDSNIVALGAVAEQLQQERDRVVVAETLRAIRDYRGIHTRNPESSILGLDPKTLANRRDLRAKAQRTLDRPE